MVNSKSYRVKLYQGLHLFFQTFLVLLIIAVMIIWALLLASVAQNGIQRSVLHPSHDNTLIALNDTENRNAQSNGNVPNWGERNYSSSIKVCQITNLAIPELFAFIGLLSVISSDVYWSAISGLGLFVFWILDHQRVPGLLFSWTASNSFEVFLIIGHALHLITWSFLLLHGGLLTLRWRLQKHKLARSLLRRPPPLSLPVYCQYGPNFSGHYLATGQSPSNRAFAPPYYDSANVFPPPPPPPTFEAIQIRSTRATSNVN